jgi:hypothetical protein
MALQQTLRALEEEGAEADTALRTAWVRWFQLVTMVAILGNSTVLAMLGSLSDEKDEQTLLLTEFVLSVFFLVEGGMQVACDGSLTKYFESGEHIFEFLVQLPTMAKVVASLNGGADTEVVGLLRALGILRLLRASKYFVFRPIWLMLVRTAQSWVPVMNLVSTALSEPLQQATSSGCLRG